jgi:TetR/AcrR family transcriptional regulator, cholesterol catabolism regulator
MTPVVSGRPEERGGIVGSTGPTARTPAVSRRERKKQETHRRIFEAADGLFSRKGYAAVTTQEVAEAADVGAGTLFRYARNKAELLIMVMNERLRLGAERGLVIAERGGSPAEAIFGLVEPLIQAALSQPENTAVYQREVLFGVDGPYRAEALGRIRELEDAMGAVLIQHAETHEVRSGADARRAAGTIFSVLYLKLVRLELGRVSPQALPDVLRSDVEYLVRELLGTR